MIQQELQPFVNTRRDEAFQFLGLPTIMRASGEATNGGFGLVEHLTLPPGFASPYHVHRREDEAFYILEGRVAFVCDGDWIAAGPGDFVFGPRNVPHGFAVDGETPAKMLLLCVPSGFERFVSELSVPSSSAPIPPDMGRLLEVAAKYGIEILGPLPARSEKWSQESTSDMAVIDAIRAAHIAALNERDSAAWIRLFSDDAVQMPPNAPANIGKSAIQVWSEGFLRMFKADFRVVPTQVRLANDLAVEDGTYTIGLSSDDGSVQFEDFGKYVTVYERNATGWSIAKDIWNSDKQPGG
ncbi:MAG TPA: cupin domain-containing protein [Fimbriimonas sp.]|nr:cupin domain-containing protein [Fimbriimonas sp.]